MWRGKQTKARFRLDECVIFLLSSQRHTAFYRLNIEVAREPLYGGYALLSLSVAM